MGRFTTPFGSFELNRYPRRPGETLQAWDAADELALNDLGGIRGKRILILNDSFGALSVALGYHRPVMQSDSHIAAWSTRENLLANGLEEDSVSIMTSLDGHQGRYDLVLVRVTKTLALLEDELLRLKPHLGSHSRVLGLGMVKQIHRSTLELFERIIGPTRTSLARRKARLIHPQVDLALDLPPSPYPVTYTLEGADYRICNHANVFSRDRLDIGTRFFLENFPDTARFRSVVDLGCGNGILGLMAASGNPDCQVTFVDESHMAVASARESFAWSGLGNRARFLVGDCLEGVEAGSSDLILCNPPFHQQQVVGDAISWRMFSQSRTCLRKGGELWIIGNRHLKYHVKLKRLFGNVEQVASNPKFVILQSRKP